MAFCRQRDFRDQKVTTSASILAALVALGVASCSSANPPVAETRANLRVIDSAQTAPSWNLTADSVITYRIEVPTPRGRDTLIDVVTPLPILIGDSLVVGLRIATKSEDEAERRLFRFRISSGDLDIWPLPPDVWGYYNDVVPSPDGRYLAYVADSDSGTVGVVRELETGREILRGGRGGGCDCDVDLNHARWFPPDSFEIAVAHRDTQGDWHIIAGRASTRSLTVTRVAKEPGWHAQPPH